MALAYSSSPLSDLWRGRGGEGGDSRQGSIQTLRDFNEHWSAGNRGDQDIEQGQTRDSQKQRRLSSTARSHKQEVQPHRLLLLFHLEHHSTSCPGDITNLTPLPLPPPLREQCAQEPTTQSLVRFTLLLLMLLRSEESFIVVMIYDAAAATVPQNGGGAPDGR